MINLKNKMQNCRIDVLGYEFETSSSGEDLNWLNIGLNAEDKGNKWRAQGAFLRTEELKHLLDWFIHINNEGNKDSKISFLENEISFEYDANQERLVVNLDYNFHPNGKNYDYKRDEEYQLEFPLSLSKILYISEGLKKVIDKFPVRLINS